MKYFVLKVGVPSSEFEKTCDDLSEIKSAVTHAVGCRGNPVTGAIDMFMSINADEPYHERSLFMLSLSTSYFPDDFIRGEGPVDLYNVSDELTLEVADDVYPVDDAANYSFIALYIEVWQRTGPLREKFYPLRVEQPFDAEEHEDRLLKEMGR